MPNRQVYVSLYYCVRMCRTMFVSLCYYVRMCRICPHTSMYVCVVCVLILVCMCRNTIYICSLYIRSYAAGLRMLKYADMSYAAGLRMLKYADMSYAAGLRMLKYADMNWYAEVC